MPNTMSDRQEELDHLAPEKELLFSASLTASFEFVVKSIDESSNFLVFFGFSPMPMTSLHRAKTVSFLVNSFTRVAYKGVPSPNASFSDRGS